MSKNPDEPHKANILVVDDQPDNLRVLSSMLKERGYSVRKALSGHMALTACQTEPPDLVLLDINMPEMDGYEVCACLKADEKTRDISVIFISVLDDVFDKIKAFRVGGIDYITKPFQTEEVVIRVENQLTIKQLQIRLKQKNRLLEEQNALLLQEIEKRRLTEAALQKANEQLKQLACSDSLTGISNRRYFDEYLQREWQRAAREQIPLSLILGDIDYFKSYNDTYGHQAGDDCLKQVAGAIRRAVKRPADLVARYGGEEFAVLLPNTSSAGAVHVAQMIQLEVQRLNIVHSPFCASKHITLSLGISTIIPSPQILPAVLISDTDKALYEAKAQGRNQYCTYHRSDQTVLHPPGELWNAGQTSICLNRENITDLT